MKTSFNDPPYNIRALCEDLFDLSAKNQVFTFRDTIYNPHKGVLDEALIAHEEVHTKQQGDTPAKWWDKYFQDDVFRFEQELEAYQAQYQFLKGKITDRNELYRRLYSMANDLSGVMYGKITTHQQAMGRIKGA